MPLVYADTSALFALFHPRDIFADTVMAAVKKESPEFVYWAFLKFELRHVLRQSNTDTYGAAALRALRAAENNGSRLRWQKMEANRVIEDADALSMQHAAGLTAGAADWFHVAAARKISFLASLDEFWTCDAAQAKAAQTVGLPTRLFKD
jgi:predicted nucleic acid-binding protein